MHRGISENADRFDIAFDRYGCEDLDMDVRTNLARSPFLFVPKAVVYHLGSKTEFYAYTAAYVRVK